MSIKFKKTPILLFLIFLIGFYFRTYNINWDEGHYFHPDERAIIMTITSLAIPTSFGQFLSPNSTLNPHFFAYGNFPMYLLFAVANFASLFSSTLSQYQGMYVVGRLISASFDATTILIVFFIARKIFGKKVALLSSFFYSVSVLPIQLSHFFAVDTMLTTFMTATILSAIYYIEKKTKRNAILIGTFYGFALATKISSLILFPVLAMVFILPFVKAVLSKKLHLSHVLNFSLFILLAGLVFCLAQPYVVIDFKNFVSQTTLQSQMSKDPFVFPYTLQYVGKLPYLHELKEIFFWGQGLLLATLSFTGLILLITKTFKKRIKHFYGTLLIIGYFILYFGVFGSFAVGWMRYMLPMYPILGIFAGWVVVNSLKTIYLPLLYKKLVLAFIAIILILYPLSFVQIYSRPNTRVIASDWINKNIPFGSKLAVEHWDDGLPIYGVSNYTQLTLPLYDPDTPEKWVEINSTLEKTDYIIIASNRLYVPLQKLTNCKKLPSWRCYPITAKYYKNLFSEKLGFRKVAEFTSYPTIPIINYSFSDQEAEENFTVFDHPKIIIFKKTK